MHQREKNMILSPGWLLTAVITFTGSRSGCSS